MPKPERRPGSEQDGRVAVEAAATESILEVRSAGSESVVSLRGEVDLYTSGQLRTCLEELADSGEKRVVLDLRNLVFIDSSGLGAMVRGMRRMRQSGGELVLRSPRGHTARLLEVTGLKQVLAVEA